MYNLERLHFSSSCLRMRRRSSSVRRRHFTSEDESALARRLASMYLEPPPQINQIDVVGLREDGWIDLGECKWGNVVSLPAAGEELESKVGQYRNPRQATIDRRLFLRSLKSHRKPLLTTLRVHTLEDLYA